MKSCPRCGAQPPSGARYCVMCGYRLEPVEPAPAAPYGTSTLLGSRLTVSIAAVAIAAAILAGIVVLVETLR